jgi:hypothetical protein
VMANPQILYNYKTRRFTKLFSLSPGPTLCHINLNTFASTLILSSKLSLSFMLHHIKVLYKFNAHYAILYSILWRRWQQQQHKRRQQHIGTKHISQAKKHYM